MAARDALRGVLVAKLGEADASLFTDAELDKLISERFTSWQLLTKATRADWQAMGLPLGLFAAIQAAGAASAGPSMAGGAGAGTSTSGRSMPTDVGLVGDEGEGLAARRVRLMRRQTCLAIFAGCAKHGFQLLKGPPRSGKTSLLQLLEKLAREAGYTEVIYLNMAWMTDAYNSWEEFFKDKTGGKQWRRYASLSGGGASDNSSSTPDVLILLDEMQAVYRRQPQLQGLLAYMKTLSAAISGRARLVVAALYGDSPSTGDAAQMAISTPFEYKSYHVVGLLPGSLEDTTFFRPAAGSAAGQTSLGLSQAEFDDLWDLSWTVDERWPSDTFLNRDAIKRHLYETTAGQVGVITAIFDDLQTSLDTSRKRGVLSSGAGDMQYMRLFRSGEVYTNLRGQRAFFKERLSPGEPAYELMTQLLDVTWQEGQSTMYLPPEVYAQLKIFHANGWLRCDEAKQRYAFWTPMHMDLYRNQLYTATLPAADIKSLRGLLELAIRRMSASTLRNTLSKRSSGEGVLERHLQMEFYRACYTVLPKGWRADPDVNMGGAGWVDFWVWPKDWAVELLCGGIAMSEHEQRFAPGGKYSLWPFQEYAVLDFRSPAGPRPLKRRASAGSYHVQFSADYTMATCIAADMGNQLFSVRLHA